MSKKICSRIYIVIDPDKKKEEIIKQLFKLKRESIAALQIWDNPDIDTIDEELLNKIFQIFKNKTPILINNKWKLLKKFEFDGVHFDEIPKELDKIVSKIGHDFIKGITLNNDLKIVEKAEKLNFDYLSFCALFPSKTVDNCEIVNPETIQECSKITSMPIFLSGGITPNKIHQLKYLSFQGIAVVSGIMKAKDSKKKFKKYKFELNKL